MSASNSNQHPPTSLNDHPPQSNANAHIDPNNSYTANDNQLAGLVEAATAAADQDQDLSHWAAAAAATAASHQQLDAYGGDMHLGEDGFGDTNFGGGIGSGRHLRVPNEHSQDSGLSRTVSKKRKRNDENLDPALAGPGVSGSQQQRSQSGLKGSHLYAGENGDVHPQFVQSLHEARAVGVHSAAALFRQPSTNKKYTRPPMSKLFASLELTPENFLHLQAAAKVFMLDDDHPDRRECVGQRGKGDTEMVKLRLWNCVKHFLEAEGHGERFFGENAATDTPNPRTYIWPRDQQKIISLVIPLLRRMVTNERQRQYAIETRRGGAPDDRRRRQTNEGFQDSFSPDQQLQMHEQDNRAKGVDQTIQSSSTGQNHQDPIDPTQIMDLGLTDLLLDGYTMDWNDFAKSYEMYNQGYELDNLWSLSGLQQPQWHGLVAAVDSHYRVVHNGEYDCPGPCEDANVNRIIHADSTMGLPWRIGGERNIPARDDFASSITRDVSRIIRENIATRQGGPTTHVSAPDHQFHHQPFVPIAPSTNISNNQTYVRINILQKGKRILPRFDIPAAQCPNTERLKQAIMRRYPTQIPGLSFLQDPDNVDPVTQQARDAASSYWRTRVLLPEGLVTIHNEKEWTIALLSADTVDWMDGELKVLVEVDSNSSQ
ncbi:uncharacterized protein N7483_005918 [Penicillium malachiteum]|uniref:uncharacterized protein n=1 Tax=Penicillium malachiteum TaxID=1324776 RepID=UPI0025471931|nr:uncharacterized protein N7483_005918 [Penicillium malachiteum]KAJ5731410.1 hypothetical protein N7483_005918 [Penicillium malachiteum]